MKALAQSAYGIWRFRQLIPQEMKRDVIRGALRLNFRVGSLPNPVFLMGYHLSFFGEFQPRFLFNEIFIEQVYHFRSNKQRPLIIDCGSNIGMSIMYFKRLHPEARVIGFEPDPDTFTKLTENIAQNHLTDIELHNCALSDNDGTLEFHNDPEEAGSLMMGRQAGRFESEKIVVPARKLSRFITEPVDLLKMDIEGGEYAVLPELAASNTLALVQNIHLEYHHHHQERDSDQMSSMLKLLEDQGFGYQIRSNPYPHNWSEPQTYQDMSIFCYRKHAPVLN